MSPNHRALKAAAAAFAEAAKTARASALPNAEALIASARAYHAYHACLDDRDETYLPAARAAKDLFDRAQAAYQAARAAAKRALGAYHAAAEQSRARSSGKLEAHDRSDRWAGARHARWHARRGVPQRSFFCS